MTQLSILPGDKPYLPLCRCSRCGGQVGTKVVVAEWNGLEFWYCSRCVLEDQTK